MCKKRLFALALTAAISAGMVLPTGAAGANDVPEDSWFYGGVSYCIAEGYMTTQPDGKFYPAQKITQAQLIQIMWAVSGKPAMENADKTKWYSEAAAWGEENALLPLAGESVFAPDAPVTREQMAAMLYRDVQNRGGGFTGAWMMRLDYADIAQLSGFAFEPMCWLTMKGVISGTDGNRLAPKGDMSRAELAVMIKKFVETSQVETV